MSFVWYHRNSDLKLLNPKNDFTLRDEYTLYKAAAPKVSLPFSSEDVSFLTTSLGVSLNIPSQFPQRQSFQTVWLSVCFKTLKWMYTSESSFLEWCFPVLFPVISIFTIVFNMLQNISFSILQEQYSKTALWEKTCNSLSEMQTSQSSFSESFSPIVIWRYLLFPHQPICAPECPFMNPSVVQFQNFVTEKHFHLCEMNRHFCHNAVSQKVSFQFLSEDISFSTIAVNILLNIPGSYYSQRDSLNPSEKRGLTLRGKCICQKAFLHQSPLEYLSEDISVFTVRLKVLPIIP